VAEIPCPSVKEDMTDIPNGTVFNFNAGDYAVTQAPFASRELTKRFLIPGLKQLWLT
jgi:hypothetical protein